MSVLLAIILLENMQEQDNIILCGGFSLLSTTLIIMNSLLIRHNGK